MPSPNGGGETQITAGSKQSGTMGGMWNDRSRVAGHRRIHRRGHRAQPGDGQGVSPADRLPVRRVLLLLSRPHQYRLRRAVDEQGPGADRHHVRFRQYIILPDLHDLRGAEQSAAGPLRRPDLDRADHGDLGHRLHRDHVRDGPHQPLSHPRAGRPGGGRLRPRGHSLSQLLVPRRPPRPGHGAADDGHARHLHAGLADVGAHPAAARRARHRRLALAVPAGGPALDHSRRRDVFLSDRQTEGCQMADGRGTQHHSAGARQ